MYILLSLTPLCDVRLPIYKPVVESIDGACVVAVVIESLEKEIDHDLVVEKLAFHVGLELILAHL